ncbi:MAG TPA: N-acetylmuramoyl-L-alanine amidase, partial [Anaerolineae bacterium]|nr:N-acetylmuramoyl-L-alanine amidase [Anaerolineae bacterium]
LGNYYTQRATYPDYTLAGCSSAYGNGIVEDFNNAEAVNQFLLQYLWNAGADAWTVRERDMNTSMLIVDDSQAAFTTQGTWSTGAAGYANSYHAATTVSGAATATATWTFTPPSTDTYAVYVWYPYPSGVTRTADAHYFIDHAGATTPVTITQTRDGSNWRYLGQYPFYGGQPAHIRLNNQSQVSGLTVLADAIRIGGGTGDVSVAGAPASGKPRWEEQSRQYTKWVGLPDVDNLNDVIVRPIYSEWEKEPGEDSVYVAWHTNGYNGCTSASGTESYVYLSPTVGSTLLQYSVHTALLNGLKTKWDPNWIDRGLKSADFGELRLLNSMPGVLLENGYHDNLNDERAQRDPKFNLISARAIYHGLVAYWNTTQPGNVPLIFLPEAPTHLIVRNDGTGRVIATWQPGPTDNTGTLGGAATAYRVYTSTDGFGWNDGLRTTQLIYTFTNLLPNQLIYVRVTGVNAGGESFPTPVLAARMSTSGLAPVLLVSGNDRIDYSQLIQQSDGPDGLNRRMFLDRINRYDYIIQHAEVITLPFDSAQHASVTDGSIGLGNYSIVDWIAGEDQSPDTALKSSDQTALTNFMNGGGSLFISGSEIGYDLTNLGATPFYNQVLHAAFAADNGDTAHAYLVNAQPGSLFNGLGTITFDNSTQGTYNVNWPDAFAPIAPAASALVYNGGATAGMQYDS